MNGRKVYKLVKCAICECRIGVEEVDNDKMVLYLCERCTKTIKQGIERMERKRNHETPDYYKKSSKGR